VRAGTLHNVTKCYVFQSFGSNGVAFAWGGKLIWARGAGWGLRGLKLLNMGRGCNIWTSKGGGFAF